METYKERQFEANNIAFTVWMVFFAMLFASLFLFYALYRFRGTPWPPMGFEKVPLFLPTLSTGVLALSSFSVHLLQDRYINDIKSGKNFYYITLILGGVFLFLQNALWIQLKKDGLSVESGIFSSLIHAFTWIHAAHIILGLGFLLYMKKFLKKENYGKAIYFQRVEQIARFWHFLGIVWLLMFVTLFLV